MEILDIFIPKNLPEWLSPSYEIKGKTVPGTGRLFPSQEFGERAMEKEIGIFAVLYTSTRFGVRV